MGVYAQKLFVESGSLTNNGVCFFQFSFHYLDRKSYARKPFLELGSLTINGVCIFQFCFHYFGQETPKCPSYARITLLGWLVRLIDKT